LKAELDDKNKFLNMFDASLIVDRQDFKLAQHGGASICYMNGIWKFDDGCITSEIKEPDWAAIKAKKPYYITYKTNDA